MLTDCQACDEGIAIWRVSFPASPVAARTYNVCEMCYFKVEDLDTVIKVRLP